MPKGKPAGMACIQLDENLGCKIFGHPERPAVCAGLKPSFEMCGASKEQAMFYLTQLEYRADDVAVGTQPGGFYGGWITPELVGPFKGGPGSDIW